MRRLWSLVVLLALVSGPGLAVGGYGVVETIGTGTDTIDVLYAGGTPYEIGYWHGFLLRAKVQKTVQVVLQLAAQEAGPGALLAAWNMMAPFVSEEFQQELAGLAEGSGVPLTEMQQVHAFPDLSEYHCSAFNAFGSATANGHMLQMRILDYAMELEVQDRPLILVVDPRGGYRYVNIGFTGMIGCIAGLNSLGIGVSEMGDDFDYASETLAGIPMPFLLRDVIAHATSFDEALAMIRDAHRTSSLWYLVGDAQAPTAAVFQTSPVTFQYWGPGTAPPQYPTLANVCYVGHYMDRLYNDLRLNLGQITPQIAIEIARHNIIPNGNLLDAVYDLDTGEIWVAYANGLEDAGKQQFVYLDTKVFVSPPYVTAVSPAEGAADVSGNAVVTSQFSKPLLAASVNTDTFKLTGPGGAVIAGTVSYDDGDSQASFTPSAPLARGRYTASVVGGSGGMKGVNGAALVADVSWTFSVPEDRVPPEVVITFPSDGCTARGLITIQVQAIDGGGVERVEVFVDGVNVAIDRTAPYQATWDTRPLSVREGLHTVKAWAFDLQGNNRQVDAVANIDNTTFDDVPKSSYCWAAVEILVREGVDQGCSYQPPLFCPDRNVTRAEMAIMLCRVRGWAPYFPATPTFLDVPVTDPAYGYIEALYANKITDGCALRPSRLFCPSNLISRGQMAGLLCRAARIATARPPVATFGDVAPTSIFYPYVEGLYQHQPRVVYGCSLQPRLFCPTKPVSRGYLAEFLRRAFHLSL